MVNPVSPNAIDALRLRTAKAMLETLFGYDTFDEDSPIGPRLAEEAKAIAHSSDSGAYENNFNKILDEYNNKSLIERTTILDAYHSSGINAALTLLNARLEGLEVYEGLVNVISRMDTDATSNLWPDDDWILGHFGIHFSYCLMGKFAKPYYSYLGAQSTYDWWIRKYRGKGMETIERIGFTNAALTAYLASNINKVSRFGVTMRTLVKRTIGLFDEDPDYGVTFVEVMGDYDILRGDLTIPLQRIIDSVEGGLPASFIIETAKAMATTADELNDRILSTLRTIDGKTITSGLSIGLTADEPLRSDYGLYYSMHTIAHIACLFTDKDIGDFYYNGIANVPEDNEDTVHMIGRTLNPTTMDRLSELNDLVSSVPVDVWSMMETRNNGGGFADLLPTDSDRNEMGWNSESSAVLRDNAKRILCLGADAAWRWMVWTRVQSDMYHIMMIRDDDGEPVLDTPKQSYHALRPEVMDWVGNGTIPKTITYENVDGEDVVMDLVDPELWSFYHGRWSIVPADVLSGIPTTWKEALEKKAEYYGLVTIYDCALRNALRPCEQ